MNHFPLRVRNALIDMDGVLYDSMPQHARAWQQLFTELNLPTDMEEFFLYEGMVGEEIIKNIFMRERAKIVNDDEARRIYSRKTELFRLQGDPPLMPGAADMLRALCSAGVNRVLVTGSGQRTLIDRLQRDYPGVFLPHLMVTSRNVTHGKPHPEPYLKGLALAGADPADTIVIENAPLGVRSAKKAGLFTVAVTTGPIPLSAFHEERADLIFNSMPEFASVLPDMLLPW